MPEVLVSGLGGLRCLRLRFEHFEKLCYFSIFRMEMWDVKRKKKEKESWKSVLFARFDA